MMLAKALDVKLNKIHLETMELNEHLKPEFLKINPQHTLPTIVDNDFILWESRAILMYLNDKYAKNDDLYPNDAKIRATINRMLYFDMGSLYQRFGEYYFPIFLHEKAEDPLKYEKMVEAVKILDELLSKSKYSAGNHITLSDYSLYSTIATYDSAGFDLTGFKNILKWFDLCKSTLVGIEESEEGLESMRKFVKEFYASKK